MFFALGWALVFVLLALWSLAAWALHGLTVWALANAGSLSAAVPAGDGMGIPPALAVWLPPEWVAAAGGLLAGLMPTMESLLGWLPALAGGVTVAAWVVWALGAVLIVVGGALAHALGAMLRRRTAPPPASTLSPLSAR